MFRGKKYQESAKLIDKSAQYEAAEGMDLICKTAKAKFDETVELHVKLNSLVKLGLSGLADEVHALSGFILSALVDQLGALLIFLASKQCYSSS